MTSIEDAPPLDWRPASKTTHVPVNPERERKLREAQAARDRVAASDGSLVKLQSDRDAPLFVPEVVVPDWLYGQTVNVVSGASGSGKTVTMSDLACAVAAGDEWQGIKLNGPRRVWILAAEDPGAWFAARDRYCARHGLDDLTALEIFHEGVSLDGDKLAEMVARALSTGEYPDVIIIDTLDAITAGGAQANRTVGRMLDRIKSTLVRQLGACVILVTHEDETGKAVGARMLRTSVYNTLRVSRNATDGSIALNMYRNRTPGDEQGQTVFYAVTNGVMLPCVPEAEHSPVFDALRYIEECPTGSASLRDVAQAVRLTLDDASGMLDSMRRAGMVGFDAGTRTYHVA